LGGLAALATLGALLVFSASAQATITITSVLPASPAVAGQAFEVTATNSTGGPVVLTLTTRPTDDPACSWTKPPEEPGLLEEEGYYAPLPGATQHPSGSTVYLVTAGACTVIASSEGTSVSQEIIVTKNPSEKMVFTTTPPTNATVGGTYSPKVRETPVVAVSYFVSTGYVCTVQAGTLVFLHGGTCTITVRQAGLNGPGETEAEQSFKVAGGPNEPTTPEAQQTPTKKTPTKVKRTAAKKSHISARVRRVLLREALAVAARHKERGPSDIEALRITEAQAQELENQTRQGTTNRTGGRKAVYFVAMRGSFKEACTTGTCPAESVLMLRLSTKTGQVMDSSLTNSYPNLAAVGVPVALTSSRKK
jgi:hypothetical protein